MGLCLNAQAALRNEVLDDFSDTVAWRASASDQVQARLRRDADGSLCLDYDFAGVSGYAVMRRALAVGWPERFDVVARLKSIGAVNDFQFKLVDASGDNVWWVNRPNATGAGAGASALPSVLGELKIRSRHIGFAWGPAGDRALRQTQFVEFVVSAGRDGGKGALCLARLKLVERASDHPPWPQPRTSVRRGVFDVDLGALREFNGLALHWPTGAPGAAATAAPTPRSVRAKGRRRTRAAGGVRPPGPAVGLSYDVRASDDGHAWRTLRRVRRSDGGLDALFLPESEARHLRIDLPKGAPAPLLELRSAAQWSDFNGVLAELAAAAPRGDLPRAFVGEQNYWTLVGVDGGGARSGLMSEDGAIEVGRGGFSVEPSVLLADGTRVTWAQATLRQSLPEGYLPSPIVHWQHAAVALDVGAVADGTAASPELLARYTLHNPTALPQTMTLMLAVRPWQVNPPQQFLATPGGATAVKALRWNAQGLTINERVALRFTQAPQKVSALAFDGGLTLAALQAAPTLSVTGDPQAHASAAVQFRVTLAPGEARTFGWTAPLGAAPSRNGPLDAASLDARFDAAAAHWRERLNRVVVRLPPEAQPIADTLRSALAQILMSRHGAALQPGTRSYARSWVRDGAMMVAGLVRLGEVDAAREFVDWFGSRVFASGKVPCCVDQRGADPVVENDSHGQYLYAVAEVWRHTGDQAFLQRHWPRVQRVVGWMEVLRQSERGASNQTPARAHLFGLLPPSISHEGYSDKPAYAYWDDFWALRGYKDAVQIAQALGQRAQAASWSGWRDEFQREFMTSISATAARCGIGFIAGAADRCDFDATSTTMALNPAQAEVPAPLLAATFERYWQEASARASGRRPWKDYTPYELRTVGALTRLGQAQRAHAMLEFFFKDQRPHGWNQWAEVVLPDPREPRFLGDMPHAWVSSDYIRSALDLFAFEREADDALVIGAGLEPEWLLAAGGVQVRGLSTPYGPLDYRLERQGTGWVLELARPLHGLRRGVLLRWPGSAPLPRATHQGQPLPWDGRDLLLPPPPVTVQLSLE
jgi:hypothetical protein